MNKKIKTREKKSGGNRLKRGTTARVILGCLAVAGLVTMAVLAPNAIQALSIFGFGKKKYHLKSYLQSTVGRLHKKGLIEFVQDGENRYIRLTQKGEVALSCHEARNYSMDNKPRKWDGKWRLVIFDIPEALQPSRDILRDSLINAGFVKVQNSVWAYPHDCEEFIFLLKTNFELGKKVLYLVVEKIENDKWLKQEFGLA